MTMTILPSLRLRKGVAGQPQANVLRRYDDGSEQFARLIVDRQAKRAFSIKNVEKLLQT